MVELDAALRPGSPTEIRIEIAKNFTVMAARTGDKDDIRGQQMIYVEDLADVPMVALRQACSDYRRGIVGDRKWAPTPAEIRHRATALLKPLRSEFADLSAILAQGAERKAIGASVSTADRMRAIIRGVIGEAPAFPPPKEVRDMRTELRREEAAKDRLLEMRYAERPFSVSDELQRKLNVP